MRHRIGQTQAWRSNKTAGGTGSGKPRHGEAIKPQESESSYVKAARVSRHSTTINSNPFTLGRNLKGRVQDINPFSGEVVYGYRNAMQAILRWAGGGVR
jgi:hypothetical protein